MPAPQRFNAWIDREVGSNAPQHSLLVYPEGTRSQRHASLPLKRGMLRYAHSRGLPLQVSRRPYVALRRIPVLAAGRQAALRCGLRRASSSPRLLADAASCSARCAPSFAGGHHCRQGAGAERAPPLGALQPPPHHRLLGCAGGAGERAGRRRLPLLAGSRRRPAAAAAAASLLQPALDARRRAACPPAAEVLESSSFEDFEAFAAAVQALWDAQWEAVHAAAPTGEPGLACSSRACLGAPLSGRHVPCGWPFL